MVISKSTRVSHHRLRLHHRNGAAVLEAARLMNNPDVKAYFGMNGPAHARHTGQTAPRLARLQAMAAAHEPVFSVPQAIGAADATAIRYLGERFSYGRLAQLIDQFAASLAELGVGR